METIRQKVSRVRDIVREVYPYTHTYNDKRKDGMRRLKFSRMNYRKIDKDYATMENDIRTKLTSNQIQFESVRFRQTIGDSGYHYIYLAVIIKE